MQGGYETAKQRHWKVFDLNDMKSDPGGKLIGFDSQWVINISTAPVATSGSGVSSVEILSPKSSPNGLLHQDPPSMIHSAVHWRHHSNSPVQIRKEIRYLKYFIAPIYVKDES